jgi:hypothetical protein
MAIADGPDAASAGLAMARLPLFDVSAAASAVAVTDGPDDPVAVLAPVDQDDEPPPVFVAPSPRRSPAPEPPHDKRPRPAT